MTYLIWKGFKSTVTENCDCGCERCPVGQTLCPTSNICIDDDLWCDGIVQCPDDEKDCDNWSISDMTVSPRVIKPKGELDIQSNQQHYILHSLILEKEVN